MPISSVSWVNAWVALRRIGHDSATTSNAGEQVWVVITNSTIQQYSDRLHNLVRPRNPYLETIIRCQALRLLSASSPVWKRAPTPMPSRN